jgi:hypothetical protein
MGKGKCGLILAILLVAGWREMWNEVWDEAFDW